MQMVDERVFHVRAGEAAPAAPTSLVEAGFKERSDLQEWVLSHPQILGDDVLIITSEFNRWQSSSGDRQLSRLDVLGIDSDGRLVVAELKRDKAPDNVQLQAINYAALVSSFTEDDIVHWYHQHLITTDPEATEESARARIIEHCGELDSETLQSPKIVLVAGEYSPVTIAAVVWLVEQGLDLTLQKAQAYRISSGEIVLTVSQVYPLPAVDDLRISPQRAAAKKEQEKSRTRREGSTVVRLVKSRAIADGTQLTLEPTNEVQPEVRDQIRAWIAEKPERGRAVWRNNSATPLTWEEDGQDYRPTTIVKQVVEQASGIVRGFAGPRWWRTPDGRTLPEVAGATYDRTFDWDPLHAVLEQLPEGRWTSYGDLASVVGTAAQPLGGHVANCRECPNAWRVLDSNGMSRPQFAWHDPAQTETQQERLETEGVTFSADGRADAAQRLSAEELIELSEDAA